MAKRLIQALTIVLATSLVALVSFTVGASGGPTGGPTGGDDADSGKSFLHRMHSIGHRLHGHGGAHGHGDSEFGRHLDELLTQLDLTPEQADRLEAIRRNFTFQGNQASASMTALHDELVAQFEQGHIDADGVRSTIDQHVEQIRATAYSVTDDVIALVDSFDPGQRRIVLDHLRSAHRGGDGAF